MYFDEPSEVISKLSEYHKIVEIQLTEFRLWQLKESPKQGGGIV